MTTLTSILLASVAASLVSFSGGVLAIFNEERMRRATHYIVSFAVGALFAVSFLHLIPEAAEMGSLDRVLPFVLGGILLFFLLEKFIFWYHCHGEKECPIHPYSYLILWGDFIHNFVDGIILALALVAGAFIYLAAVDLFPELHESSNISHTFAQLFFILVGVVLVTLPEFFIG